MINPEALRSWENWFMVLIIVMVGWGTAAVLQQFIQSAINIHSCDPAHMIFLLGNTNSLFCIDLINVISRCVCSLSSCLKITFVGAFFAWFVISLGNCFPLCCAALSVTWRGFFFFFFLCLIPFVAMRTESAKALCFIVIMHAPSVIRKTKPISPDPDGLLHARHHIYY